MPTALILGLQNYRSLASENLFIFQMINDEQVFLETSLH